MVNGRNELLTSNVEENDKFLLSALFPYLVVDVQIEDEAVVGAGAAVSELKAAIAHILQQG